MRARGAVASVLAVLLLAFSCVASACTTSCDLSGLRHGAAAADHAGAHSGRGSAAPGAAPAVEHCVMAGMEHSAGAGSARIGAESVCSHSRCGEQMTLLRAGEEPFARVTQLCANAGWSAMATLPPVLRTQAVLLESFSKRVTPPVYLLTQLRV